MKHTLLILALAAAVSAPAADAVKQTPDLLPKQSSRTWLADATLEPYGTVSWQGLNGSARAGAGANLVSHITKGFSIWGFGESDNTGHAFFDRAGLGLRYEAQLINHIKGDAGVAYGYNFEGVTTLDSSRLGKPGKPGGEVVNTYKQEKFGFLRLPIGITINMIQSAKFEAGLRLAYAFDISGNGKHGTADGRGFLGPTATLKW